MHRPSRRMRIFNDRYPLVGPAFYAVSLQLFLTQWFVASRWPTQYSYAANVISDLGNTACGQFGDRYVCSPWYGWMNASFIVLGATMIAGSTLIYQEFRRSRASLIGFSMMAAAGFGTILVGLAAENTYPPIHATGAFLVFVFGNLAMIILGSSLQISRAFRAYSIASGVIALIALYLFMTRHYLGLGQGGMERLVAHPQTVWLTLFGLYMTRSHLRKRSKK